MAGLLRVPVAGLTAGDRELPDATARYVTRVHRFRAGQRFLAFDPEARTEAEVELVAVGRGVTARIGDVRPSSAPPADRLALLWGIGKGDKPEHVISASTALGVERVTLVSAAHSVVSLADRAEARLGRYRTVAVEAARQCGRGDVPTVRGPVPLSTAVAEAALEAGALRLSLEPSAPMTLGEALASRGDAPLVLLVGPEGGFSAPELEACRSHGFGAVSLGSYVLRTELAVVAALGAVAAQRRRSA